MVDVNITGPQADDATKKLQATTSLKLTRDAETGKLSSTGVAKTDYDKALATAINDHSVEVNLKTTDQNKVTLTNSGQTGDLGVGAYGGSTKEVRETEVEGVNGQTGEMVPTTVAVTEQYINMDQATKEEQVGMSAGHSEFHEIMESYNAAKSNPGDTPGATSQGFLPAHNQAIGSDPGFIKVNFGYTGPNNKTVTIQNPTTGATVDLYTKP